LGPQIFIFLKTLIKQRNIKTIHVAVQRYLNTLIKQRNIKTILYDERHWWVSYYLKNQFLARMSTTPRSEGINEFFN